MHALSNCWHHYSIIFSEITNSCIINQPKPKIEYVLKAVGGSLTALPGVSDMIDVSIFFLLSKLMFFCFIVSLVSLLTILLLSHLVGYCEFNCHRYASVAPQDCCSTWWYPGWHKVNSKLYGFCFLLLRVVTIFLNTVWLSKYSNVFEMNVCRCSKLQLQLQLWFLLCSQPWSC